MFIQDVESEEFWERTQVLARLRGVSFREASRAVGMSESYLAAMRSKGSVPPREVRERLSHFLKGDLTFKSRPVVSMGVMARGGAQRLIPAPKNAFDPPSIIDMIRHVRSRGNVIDTTADFAAYFEAFSRPVRGMLRPNPVHMGPLSLTAQTLGLQTIEDLREAYETAPRDLCNAVLAKHRSAMNGDPVISYQKITQPLKNGEVALHEYEQLLYRVADESGETCILNYAISI